ncbi:Gfo/Idh/MocA family oxidoreductase [Georgenia daeguensis]|uniref:Gfo/Idh/MocA family oxidoreductase n=1 Tax=Georgenia daeguensis TaxID=908355 RepID=A0ABP8EV24_9MICO
MTIRVGILGCGGIAGNHVEAYREVAEVEVVACADVDRPRARSFAEKYNLPIWVGSLGELLEVGIDVLSVCTPHPTHEQAVIDAAKAGVHVLCEKPIALTTAAAQRMVDACDTAGVELGVLFQRRFWPASQKVRRTIDEGVLGAPFLAHCSVLLHRDPDYFTRDPWRGKWDTDGGGVLMTQAIHYIVSAT